MRDRRLPILPTLTVAALLAIVGAAPLARAQDDDDDEEARPPAPVANVFVVNNFQFDQWVFGNMGMGNADRARDKVESLLTLQVEELDRTCGLTPIQRKKLLLAGRGDVKRFFDRVDDLRKKYSDNKNFNFQAEFQKMWQEIQPLQTAFNAGLFGEGSIYAKSIRATLTPEQVGKFEESTRDRLHYRYWARVDLAMELLNNEVGFTDDQRRRVVDLLREETTPPLKMGQNDYYVVLYQLSRIPQGKLRPVFDDFQWGLIKRHVDQGRAMEMWLKQQGFLPGKGPVAEAKASRPYQPKAAPRGATSGG